MKIIITETESVIVQPEERSFTVITPPVVEQRPTGRQWEIDIPIEPVSIQEVWTGIKGDVRELIELLRRMR